MTENPLDLYKTIIRRHFIDKIAATVDLNLDLRRLPQKLALVWKVTQPGINLDLTCQHINGEK